MKGWTYSHALYPPKQFGLWTQSDLYQLEAMASLFTPHTIPTERDFAWLVHLGECFNTEKGELYPQLPFSLTIP